MISGIGGWVYRNGGRSAYYFWFPPTSVEQGRVGFSRRGVMVIMPNGSHKTKSRDAPDHNAREPLLPTQPSSRWDCFEAAISIKDFAGAMGWRLYTPAKRKVLQRLFSHTLRILGSAPCCEVERVSSMDDGKIVLKLLQSINNVTLKLLILRAFSE